MPKKSVIDESVFRAEAHLGVKHLMARFGVQRVTVNNYARAHKIEVFRGGPVIDAEGRLEDELILAAIRLRRRGKTPREIGPILGISGGRLRSVYQQTNNVRSADVKAFGEPAARVMKEYW